VKDVFRALLLVFVLVSIHQAFSQSDLVGHWKFDDPNNLTQANVGNDLVLSGSNTAVTGPAAGDGAVNIGPGSYYICPHGMSPSGGGSRVNEFTLVMDVKIPRSVNGIVCIRAI